MSLIERYWEEEMERGYSLNEGVTVCSNCFNDNGIIEFIINHNTHSSCSYCEAKNENIAACELDALIEHILASLSYEWGNPLDEGVPWESREGGWQLPVYDIWELLSEVDLGNVHEKTFEDICKSIHDREWCEREPYSATTGQMLFYSWNAFSKFVKNKVRYFFQSTKNPYYDEKQHDEMDPVRILDFLGVIIKKLCLINTIKEFVEIKRVRIINPSEIYNTAKELGAPPTENAKMANRMSPAGIPMFYGAFDIDTAIKETYSPCKEDKKAICGTFKPNRELVVLDLTQELLIPSIFDKHKRENRSSINFLINFINDFSKPIDRIDRSHIDYVPTQIVTEYLRYIFKLDNGTKIDGIIYPSSKCKKKKAIVIFVENEQCIDSKETFDSSLVLKLVNIESKEIEAD